MDTTNKVSQTLILYTELYLHTPVLVVARFNEDTPTDEVTHDE
jgi:hypothetical protein